MNEIPSPVEPPVAKETREQVDFAEILRRARAPIIREGFAEPWTENAASFDPAKAGWEQAGQNLLGQIDKMRFSGLVQLTPEGLTPKQVAAKAGESAKLAAADAWAAELAEQLEQMRRAVPPLVPPAVVPTPAPSPRDQSEQLPDEAEEAAAELEEEEVEAKAKKGLARFLENFDWKMAAKEGAFAIGPAIFGGALYAAFPELQTALVQLASSGAVAGLLSEGAIQALSRADLVHPRLAGLARTIAAGRGWGARLAEVSVSALGGMAVVGTIEYLTQLHAVQPAGPGAGEVSGGATGGLPPDERGGHFGGLSPDDRGAGAIVQPPAETVVPHLPQVPVDAGEAQLQTAEATARAAEAIRVAALQQGQTVAELAAQMPKQTVSEAIYQMIGDVPHRGEVTNVIFRAIGDKVNSLNEGAIKAAAQALRPIFDNIDKTVAGSGVPYTEGGRAAVEAMRGFNSSEAQAIRAANMADLEAAGNLLSNVIGPVIK